MAPRIAPVARIDIRATDAPWEFAEASRAAIDAYFAAARAANPALWNGRVLMTRAPQIADGVLSGTCFETDFASFLAWRDWGFPDAGVANVFAQGALRAADGGFLLGVMGAHTANAGRIYFPSGTPEPADIRDGRLDLAGSLMRELAEETGLAAADVSPQADWTATIDGARMALIRVLDVDAPADAVAARIMAHAAHDDEHAELAGVHVARGPMDLSPAMPDFVAAFLRHVWQGGRS